MAQDQEIKDQIRRFIADNFIFDDKKARELGDEDSFLEEGIIDSTGVLELVMFVEEKFRIEVADEDVVPENFDSLARLAEYISRKVAASLVKA